MDLRDDAFSGALGDDVAALDRVFIGHGAGGSAPFRNSVVDATTTLNGIAI